MAIQARAAIENGDLASAQASASRRQSSQRISTRRHWVLVWSLAMAGSFPAVVATPGQVRDDTLTICGMAALASMLSDQLHEGLGHAAVALSTGAYAGVLSTVAWSSAYDSRLVEAGGTLVNIVAGLVFWLVLRAARNASVQTRLFLFFSCAFNLFAGTGYFFFSGVSGFGDWAMVIAGMPHHALWRTLLVIVGIAAYYGAIEVVGTAFVRYVGVPLNDARRRGRLMLLGYFSAIVMAADIGPAESARHGVDVGVSAAGDRGCAVGSAVVAILHSAKDGARVAFRSCWTKLWVDCGRGCMRHLIHRRPWTRREAVGSRSRKQQACRAGATKAGSNSADLAQSLAG